MLQLNLPSFDANMKEVNGKQQIFDVVRKKFVALTPEEWVRQHFIHFMINTLQYPAGLMAVEAKVKVNGLKQRADIVLYNRRLKPVLVVECKAPEVAVRQSTVEQAARYNLSLGVDYLVVTNGLVSYCIHLDKAEHQHQMEQDLPSWEELVGGSW